MTLATIGCVQLNSQYDIDANLATIERAVEQAKRQGVHLLVLPENACRMGGQHQLAERFDEISQWYAQLAFKHQLFIVAGTLPCAYRPDGTPVADNKLRQVSQIFAPDGKRVARYDKIHLFRAQVADSTGSYDEGRTFEPGTNTVVAQCDIGNLLGYTDRSPSAKTGQADPGLLSIGMMVCFDLRFPAFAQQLRQAGAEILTAPSAFTYQTGKAHWQLLLQARALDAQCLVVGSAQGGTHHGKQGSRDTWGHSSIANANGELLISTGKTQIDDAFEIITTPFDIKQQQQWRQNMPLIHSHRLA
ncbi:nitrilase-related carbon-nitrogen hydrolase [Psychrobacter sp. FDAARGOS_221]|uniref:nitrilase-related carbon-nitrogen hydrolase n=1 Tax=Psychrobacter sp. FDAARGOS_221 TaxID=1975705 RepID=UPI000BB580D0|nr:nitrilase-related carbon-nitrogen hydrolase [Psychrobacter sp. FDAARGOS_221]PNK60402.1 carbon-nitrogen hydrolase [Psychrobacter sp. FDAARGOS_221]